MATIHAGNLVFDVDIDLAKLLEGNDKAQQELENLGKAAQKAEPGLDGLSHSAKGVSAALKMPEVNKLATQLSQLSGKLGLSSESAAEAAVSQNKFSGVLSTTAGKLGAGYVSSVGSATNALIKHAKAALEATNAQVENAKAAQQEAAALQGASSALVIKAAEEKKIAEAATQTAQNELLAAEAIFERRSAEIGSLEALLTRQKESLKQAEANLTVAQSEKAVAEAVRARNAVDATSAKIQRQSNAAVKEVTQAEDRAKAAKEASAAASLKLQSAVKLEAAALATVAKANDAAALATERHTLATKAQALAVSGARSALALLGGPTGILLLAAAGVYALYQAMRDNQDIEQFKRDIDDAAKKLQYFTETQAKAAAAKAVIAIKADTKDLDKTSEKISVVNAQLRYMEENPFDWMEANPFGNYDKTLESLKSKLVLLESEQEKLSDTIKINNTLLDAFSQQAENAGDISIESAKANEIYDNSVKGLTASNNVLEKAINGSLSAAEEWAAKNQLEKALDDAGISAKEATLQVAKLHDEFERKRSLTFNQALEQTKQEVIALKIEMKEGAEGVAAYRAQLQAGEMGITDQKEIDKLIAAARERVRLQQQLSESKKTMKDSKSAVDETAKAIKQLTEQNESLRIGLEQGEKAQFIHDQVMKAGTSATTAQIQEIERLANAQYQLRDAIKERQKVEQGQAFAKTEITAAKSPLEQIAIEEQAKLDKIAEFQAIDLENAQLYEDAKTAIMQQASQARQQIANDEAMKQAQAVSSMLGAASQGFDGLAGIIEATSGKSSGLYKTMFATSKAFAIAQSLLNMQLAISNAMAYSPYPANLGAMAQVAAAGSQLVSSISGMSFGGGREHGGPVDPSKFYRVGEGNKPEIMKASNGSQYMIPGDRGKVISNSDISGGTGGGAAIHQEVNFYIETTGGISNEAMQQITSKMKDVTVAVIRNEKRPGGMLRS